MLEPTVTLPKWAARVAQTALRGQRVPPHHPMQVTALGRGRARRLAQLSRLREPFQAGTQPAQAMQVQVMVIAQLYHQPQAWTRRLAQLIRAWVH